jgi:hypothetical protein
MLRAVLFHHISTTIRAGVHTAHMGITLAHGVLDSLPHALARVVKQRGVLWRPFHHPCLCA